MAKLLQLLTPDHIVAPLSAGRKRDAIREVASLLGQQPAGLDLRPFLSALFRQESQFGSRVDHGVALPHLRDACVAEPLVGLGLSEPGVDWGDGSRVHILVLIAWPERHDQAYLQTVAEVARLFSQDQVRQQSLRAGSPQAVWEVLHQESNSLPPVS